LIPDIDIWRCAKLMVDQHGERAQMEAIDKAALVGRGHVAGQQMAEGDTSHGRPAISVRSLQFTSSCTNLRPPEAGHPVDVGKFAQVFDVQTSHGEDAGS
jgi:hypothetical protein